MLLPAQAQLQGSRYNNVFLFLFNKIEKKMLGIHKKTRVEKCLQQPNRALRKQLHNN